MGIVFHGADFVKKAALIGIVFLLALVGAIAYSTMTLAQHRVEVCMGV